MNIVIEKGSPRDTQAVAQLYAELIDYLDCHINYPGWRKGLYPTLEDAQAGIDSGTLYIAKIDGEIAGTIILDHVAPPEYAQVRWAIDAQNDACIVVHTFAVHPKHLKYGVGRELMDFAVKLAKESQMKAVRLDVYENNIPACHLYERCGFTYMGTVDLGLASIGLDRFKLYEKVL